MAVRPVHDRKQEARERVWAALREAGAARFPGVKGRIPNFVGAEAAAERLAATPGWRSARVIKSNPAPAGRPSGGAGPGLADRGFRQRRRPAFSRRAWSFRR